MHLPALFYALVLPFAAQSQGGECSAEDPSDAPNVYDVCDPMLEGAPSYSVVWRASLIPEPAAQQVLLYRSDRQWLLFVSGYAFDSDTGTTVTRRREIAISDEEAAELTNLIDPRLLSALRQLPYYGSPDRVCTDGASIEIAMHENGRRHSARQHTCAGQTRINELAAAFRKLALEQDRSFDGLLYGLN